MTLAMIVRRAATLTSPSITTNRNLIATVSQLSPCLQQQFGPVILATTLYPKRQFHLAPVAQFFATNQLSTGGGGAGVGSGSGTGDNNGKWIDNKGSLSHAEYLTKYEAIELIHKLTESERKSLRHALDQYETEQVRHSLEELAANKWHIKVGQQQQHTSDKTTTTQTTTTTKAPMSTTTMVDSHGNDIESANGALRPSRGDLSKMMLVSAIPFLGFGFLDNFFMIIAGDYIEHTLGMYMCISTMAAAGLGNTISDVLGLGLAHYVEAGCEFLGICPPRLTPAQLELTIVRRLSHLGRVIGITIGCLLGMSPLWFKNKKPKETSEDELKSIT